MDLLSGLLSAVGDLLQTVLGILFGGLPGLPHLPITPPDLPIPPVVPALPPPPV